MDIFELSIECLFKICGYVNEENFTFDIDVMAGIIIKMICFIYSLTLFDIFTYSVFSMYCSFWGIQASFVIFEYAYIFKGQSFTY